MTAPLPIDLAVGFAGLERLLVQVDVNTFDAEFGWVDLTPHVRALGLRWVDGEVPVLALELHAEAALDEALVAAVEIVTPGPDPTDAARIVADWLAALDPAEVERAALERAGWGSDASAAGLVLEQLRAYASGDTGPPESLTRTDPGG